MTSEFALMFGLVYKDLLSLPFYRCTSCQTVIDQEIRPEETEELVHGPLFFAPCVPFRR
jgi:hypothetical protein